MSSFTIVHAADIHLDSPLRGLERYQGAPVERVRAATRVAFTRLVDLCIDRQAKLLLLAGDLFDGDWKDYNTGLYFVKQMVRLREAEVRVFSIRGNHDAASQLSKSLRWPGNVHEFSSTKPETVVLDDLGVAIHGQSFADRVVTDDLASGYPQARPHVLNLGVLHTSVSGREGHEPYAPCTLQTLLSKDYDYWALGHVHTREVLHERPWVVFPGNLQGRHIRERGAKGAMLIRVRDGVIEAVDFEALDVMRWRMETVDMFGVSSETQFVDRLAVLFEGLSRLDHGRPIGLRLQLTGACDFHSQVISDSQRWRQEIRALALDLAPDELWLEKIIFNTHSPLNLDSLRLDKGPLGAVLKALDELRGSESQWAELVKAELEDLAKRLPAELKSGPEALLWFQGQPGLGVDELERLLLPLLVSGGQE